jgi:hypothetical protein
MPDIASGSIRDQIITNLCTAIAGAGGPGAATVRSLATALNGKTQLPVFAVTPKQERKECVGDGTEQRSLTVRIVCVFGDPDLDGFVDQKLDPYLTWVEQRIQADQTFGGLATQSYVSEILWSIEASDQDYVGGEMSAEIMYFTAEGDPTTSGQGE